MAWGESYVAWIVLSAGSFNEGTVQDLLDDAYRLVPCTGRMVNDAIPHAELWLSHAAAKP